MEELHKSIAANEALQIQFKEEAERLRGEKQEAFLRKNTSELNLERLEGKRQEIAESSSDLVMESRELEFQLREIRENTEKLSEEMRKLETLHDEKTELANRLSEELSRAQESREAAAGRLSEAQLSEANVRQQDSFISENIRRLKNEEERLCAEQRELDSGSGKSAEAVEEKKRQIDSIRKQIGEQEKDTAAIRESLSEQTARKEELLAGQKAFFKSREELSGRISSLDREMFRLEGQRERAAERIESRISYMWDEYELTYSGACSLAKEEPETIPEIHRSIDRLKGEIKALGSVNVNAIEDYREVSERYEFLNTQHQDLVTARETLLKIIEELDTGMRLQFEEKFAQIRLEFDKVFKELFGGGHGTLVLQEDEDILEAGIQIISQPPGKKLQNMMQLSGGEKALTAIALLFAIQNLKPSPFCLLDEIEAALDDSNVDRFAKYLHKLTKYTQFIVITHRRGTMVSADRLYGITMQEKGVSTLVSVSLVESELEAQAKAGKTRF